MSSLLCSPFYTSIQNLLSLPLAFYQQLLTLMDNFEDESNFTCIKKKKKTLVKAKLNKTKPSVTEASQQSDSLTLTGSLPWFPHVVKCDSVCTNMCPWNMWLLLGPWWKKLKVSQPPHLGDSHYRIEHLGSSHCQCLKSLSTGCPFGWGSKILAELDRKLMAEISGSLHTTV